MRIVLTVPEEKLREACQRIKVFCKEHIIGEKRKELESSDEVNGVKVICEDLANVA